MGGKDLHRIWPTQDEAGPKKPAASSMDEKREILRIAGGLMAILILIGLVGGVAS